MSESKSYQEQLVKAAADAQQIAEQTGRVAWIVVCGDPNRAGPETPCNRPRAVESLCSLCKPIRRVLPRAMREAAFKAFVDAIATAQEHADAAGRERWLACYHPIDGSAPYYKVQAENRLFATGKARGVMIRKVLPRPPEGRA